MSVARITLMIFLLLTCQSCKDDNPAGDSLSPIEQAYYDDYESPKNKWGYINENGKVVIKPVYDDVKDVWDDLAAANYEGKWGYLTDKGRAVIDFQYKQAYNFSSDRAFAQDFSNQWLLIDKSGAVIDSLSYSTYHDFDGDYAVVGNDNKGIINKSGKLVVPMEYESILLDGPLFIGKQGGSYGLSSIPAIAEELIPLDVIPYEYERLYAPSHGIMRAKTNKKYTFIDVANMSYKEIGQKRFEKAYDFDYQYTVVKSDGKYSLVDKKLNIIRVLPYEKVDYIGSQRWKYKAGGKWGLLDENGDELTVAKYDLLNKYACNRIAYSINKLWGYLDENGQEIQSPKYVLVWDYADDRARVIDNRGVGFIDLAGKMVINDMFLEVRDFKNGIARFQTF